MEEYNLKYALKHLNKDRIKADLKAGGKFLLTTFGFTAAFTAASFGLTACSHKKEEVSESDTTLEETTENTIVIVEEPKEEVKEEVVDENKEEYDVIDNMEEDIVDFAKNSLPNGFIEVNEENNLDRAKMFTDAYVMMNLSSNKGQINPATIKVLNQHNILIPSEIKDNYKNFIYQLGDYMQIVTPETMIDFEILVQEKDDAKFLNELQSEIAYMNVATSSEERQTRINNIVAIRDSILTNASTTTYSSSTLYTAINMIIKADATAKAYGNVIFASDEERMQLYTTFYDGFCNELTEEGYEIEKATFSSASSFESQYFSSVAAKIESVITTYQGVKSDEYYSYEEVTERISKKIIGLYIAPKMDAVEKENSIREEISSSLTPAVGSSTTEDNVPEEAVPEEVRVKPTQTTDYSDNQTTDDADHIKPSTESTDVYIKAKGDGIRDGSAAAAAAYSASYAGHATDMPEKPLGAEPEVGSTNYNAVYTYFYNLEWNNYRASAIAMEAEAAKQNEQTTEQQITEQQTTEQKVKEKTEKVKQKTKKQTTEQQTTEQQTTEQQTTEQQTTEQQTTEQQTTEQQTTEQQTTEQQTTEQQTTEQFIPATDDESQEEITDEKIETITMSKSIRERINGLQALRSQLIQMSYDYNIDIKQNVKRV